MRGLVIAACFTVTAAAWAAPMQPYDEGVFRAAQAAGKPVLIEIHADWCAECRAQERVLGKLGAEPAYAALVRLRVDFDRQKPIVHAFGARKESTLIVVKGDREVARATGVTSEAKIRELLAPAF